MEDLCANPWRFRFMKPEQRSEEPEQRSEEPEQRSDWSFQTMAVSLRKENLEHCKNPSLSVVLRALPEGAEFIPSKFNRHEDVVAQLAGTEWSRWSPVEGPTIYNRTYVHRPDKDTLNVLRYCDYASRDHLDVTFHEPPNAFKVYELMPHVWYRKEESWSVN